VSRCFEEDGEVLVVVNYRGRGVSGDITVSFTSCDDNGCNYTTLRCLTSSYDAAIVIATYSTTWLLAGGGRGAANQCTCGATHH